MANALAKFFSETAEAIREKTGETGTMKPSEMPERIRSIQLEDAVLLKELTVTANGVYEANEKEGYSKVTVGVDSVSLLGSQAYKLTFLGADGSVLYEKYSVEGDESFDPVAEGRIETPVKEETPALRYTYLGWGESPDGEADASALTDIRTDKILYPIFSEEKIMYLARFWCNGVLIAEKETEYGAMAEAPTLELDEDYMFKGWEPSDLTVYGDTDFTAVLEAATGWVIRKEKLTVNQPTAAAYHPTKDILAVYENGTKKLTFFDTAAYPYTKLADQTITSDSPTVSALEYSFDGKTLVYLSDLGYGSYAADSTVPYAGNAHYTVSDNIMTNAKYVPNSTDWIGSYRESKAVTRFTKNCSTQGVKYGTVSNYLPSAITVNRAGSRVGVTNRDMSCTDGVAVYYLGGGRVSACPTREGGYLFCTFDYAGKYFLYVSRTAKAFFVYDTSQTPYAEKAFSSI
ncbi:MAG: hypothetical protein IKD07_03940, partial [Clostridia bacterium]|nr:hypothetical protein [Clostridia bacterium]